MCSSLWQSCSNGAAAGAGQLGDVFKESLKIAQTYTRQLLRTLEPQNTSLEHGTVHVHVPQGAVPKDGPSAGCTMVTALLSLAFNTAVIPDVAMTGAHPLPLSAASLVSSSLA